MKCLFVAAAAVLLAGCVAQYPHTPQVIGTISYEEFIHTPPNATLDITIYDAAAPDPEKAVLTQQHIIRRFRAPMPFSMWFDRAMVDKTHTYVLRAEIRVGKDIWFQTPEPIPVITLGHPQVLDVVVVFQSPGKHPSPPLAPPAGKP
ncbi:MAG: YbaY family lipoprotein [Verrucomicrobia bacterium]|nr:YbaY family lipoprotein [Verrucomicrobiota bacterium]